MLTEDLCGSIGVCLRLPGPSKRNDLSPSTVFFLEMPQRGNESLSGDYKHSHFESGGRLVHFWLNTKTNPSNRFYKLLHSFLSKRRCL